MKDWVFAALVASVGFAAAPASAMPASPQAAVENDWLLNVADGCPRSYYHHYGRCVPNARGYRGPRYDDAYDEPRYDTGLYYNDRPGYFDGPGYYDGPRYWAVPRWGCPAGRHTGRWGRCVPNW